MESAVHEATNILLSTAYLPPTQYMVKLLHHRTVWIETGEHFIKQTYRNRSVILGANGPEPLVIPVVKGRNGKQKIKDIAISYDTAWQHVHWHAIVSAYHSSPFFEFLEADFSPLYRKRFRFLFDFNMELLQVVFNIMEIDPEIRFTHEFEDVPGGCLNFRETIRPGADWSKTDPQFNPVAYSQVFSDKFGFVPNLSIADLLFNCGAASYEILLKSAG